MGCRRPGILRVGVSDFEWFLSTRCGTFCPGTGCFADAALPDCKDNENVSSKWEKLFFKKSGGRCGV